MNTLAHALHLLTAVIWVGGLFFAYVILRPTATRLMAPPLRLQLWSGVFHRFFPWIWVAVAVLPSTGVVLMSQGASGAHVHLMTLSGLVMIALFLYLNYGAVKRLHRAVIREDWSEGAEQLLIVRKVVGINLGLGLITVLIAGSGRYGY